jgi:threonine dehydrogenase-like Zn-dependent dehydrogenase
MRALTVIPGQVQSGALSDLPDSEVHADKLQVRTLAVGICGTDREILAGKYGIAPPGRERLVLGHELLGEVEEAPAGRGFERGDLVAGVVRHPDPVPCAACRIGEWDMCQNGRYTEHGIKQLDGFCAERIQLAPEFAIRLEPDLRDTGVLLEPTSVVAKAWEHIERIGHRTHSWQPRRVLVTGAGPIGLLAALLAHQRGYELHVYDRDKSETKQRLVSDLGGEYHSDAIGEACATAPDVIVECTGAAEVIMAVLGRTGRGGIVCLAGLSSGEHRISYDLGGLNRSMVLDNDVVFGTVNANRRHYEQAATALARADPRWLRRVISRRVPLSRWQEAIEHQPGDIKVVIDLTARER